MALHWTISILPGAGVLYLAGMAHCRFTINRHTDQQHCLFRPSHMGEQENNIYFRGTREGMSKMKRNREANKISVYREHRKYINFG